MSSAIIPGTGFGTHGKQPSKAARLYQVGGLSKPSKMPGYGYSLPAESCVTGSVLCNRPGSVCSDCYACRGNYTFPNVAACLFDRLACVAQDDWQQNMCDAIRAVYPNATTENPERFRWHDSGDVQSVAHLRAIVEIAREVRGVLFWLPTKEKGFLTKYIGEVGSYSVPDNLCIRFSTHYHNQTAPGWLELKGKSRRYRGNYSWVFNPASLDNGIGAAFADDTKAGAWGHPCPVSFGDEHNVGCAHYNCFECWYRDTETVVYHRHV